MDELTPKERLFIEAYLTNNFNATKAAIKAGYSENSAYSIASENLTKPHIKKYINAFLKDSSIDKLELIKRLSDIARNVFSEYLNPEGDVDLEALLRDGYGHVIKKVRRLRNGKKIVEAYDSAKAQEQLTKVFQLVNDGMSVTFNVNEEITAQEQLKAKLVELDARFNRIPQLSNEQSTAQVNPPVRETNQPLRPLSRVVESEF